MIKKIYFFLSVVFLAAGAVAQVQTWKNFSSMYNVNALAVAQGKVWAATAGGVFSYSPLTGTFKQFTTTEGLSNIQATSITVDTGNSILVGEGNGAIDELDSNGTPIRTQQDIAKSSALSKQVTNLSLVGDTLFACTPFGVVLISRSSFEVIDSYTHYIPSQSGVAATGAAIYKGNIYVASQFGLSVAPRSGINLAAPDLWHVVDTLGLSSGVNGIEVFNGALYVGTNAGLYFTNDGTTFQRFTAFTGLTAKTLALAPNSLLFSSQNGLFRLNTNGSLSTVYNGGVTLNDVVSYSDTLVIGATSQGLLSIGSTVQQIFPPGPATNIISNLSVDSSGNLWCSTSLNDVGVAFMEYNGTNWKNFNRNAFPVLPTNTYYQISAVCGNRVVAGSWGYGMALLSGDSIKIFNRSNSPLVGEPNDANFVLVGDAICDSYGNIWMTNPLAFNGNAIAVYSPKDTLWYSFNNSYSVPSGFVPIAIDAYGGIWAGDEYGDKFGEYHGLFYYNTNGTLSNKTDDKSFLITQSDGLLSNQVTSVAVDNEDQVWVGTNLGLNVLYDPSNLSFISQIYSMLDQSINGIDYDALDNKWVATNTGVYVLSKDGNTRLAQYDITNSPLLSDNVKAIACDRVRGIVYFETDYGITELKTGVIQPEVNFSKLKIFPDPAKLPVQQPIQIVGLVANSHIKIFSVDGMLVDEFDAQGGKIAYWNGTDSGGKLLPSGVYIVVAYSQDGSQSTVAKIALIHQ